MKNIYSIVILISFLLLSFVGKAQETTVLLDKNYPVSKSTSLDLNNQFGNITVSTWSKQEFSINVELVLTGLSEKEAQKIREKVQIEESAKSDIVAIKTLFKKGSINMNGSGKKFEINYEVKIPDNHSLKIKNSFGNFAIQDYNGPIDLHVEYGNLSMGKIREIMLKLAFGNGDVQSIEGGNVIIEYADRFNLQNAGDIELKSSFSKVDINTAKNIALDGKYGDLKIGRIDVLRGKSEFSGVQIKQLNKTLDLKASYVSGNLEVDNISKDFEEIILKTEFSGVTLNFESGIMVQVHVTTSFGDFIYPESKSTFNTRIEKDFEKEFKGTVGEGSSSKGRVAIHTTYGNAKIKIN
ncbi:hypothetical protein JKA74_14895 [Marivirga sp. S37H4]|uniref:Adhesin domain-containing protein n=1 Tax=Marivirga aurantiaca TaxID=2802615 RepID=A0A934X0N6_9BACT|nr:hypothetical protein [Marivirga aurantiaca]MBK6266331.1 hypothetical protein [Marivirga aurantiaca]